MVRNGSIVLGIGLVVLWIVGLANNDVGWMTWLDLAAAIIAFIGASVSPNTSRQYMIGGPVALGLGLFGLWIGSLVTHTSVGLGWANFGFGCAFVILGGLAATGERAVLPGVTRTRTV